MSPTIDREALLAWLHRKDEDAANGKRHGACVAYQTVWSEIQSGRFDSTARDAERAELEGLRAFKRSVDEALNSGDGSYRP